MDHILRKTGFERLLEYFSRESLLTFFLLATTNIYAAPQPNIISSVSIKYHQAIVKSISSNLEASGIKAKFYHVDRQSIPDGTNEFLVSIGNDAALALDEKTISAPQLRILTKVDINKSTAQKDKFYLSMTLPVCQQFALIKSLEQEWKNVSVLLANPDAYLIRKLKSCAKQYGLTLNTIFFNKYVNISDALNTSLLNSDVLLALPDPAVYNSRTVKNILLTTYRHRVPVIGFSESFVYAGALVAIHSSAKQLGKQISDLIIKHYNHKILNQIYIYPEYFEVTINNNVAKSLGIILPDKNTIKNNLKRKFYE